MIDFLKYRTICFIFSLIIFCTFLGTFFYKEYTRGFAFVYSVDFTGGTQVLLRPNKHIGSDTLKKILSENGWEQSVVREVVGNNDIFIRVKEFESDAKGLGERIRSAVEKGTNDTHIEILSIDSVGSGVGETLRWKSIRAIVLALLMMLLYIAWRFWSISFAVGAVFALFHDAIVILVCFLLLDKEISISILGAILLILGYSINDTIVIFSNIKKNIASMRNVSMYDIVNISLNQTLRRTLLTSISTALVVLSLIILGGESLRDLSLALLIGIIFGTYSSIYIASPVMLLLYGKQK